MTELIEKMKAYGADISGAMERFLDDEELYETCIHMFADDTGFADLQKAIAAQDYEAAFSAAHTLKGVTANLGLTPLYQVICDLVEPLRAKQYGNADALLQAVMDERAKFLALL